MNPITPSTLSSIFLGFNTRFQAAFSRAEPLTKRFAMEVPSSGRSNVYAFMAQLLRPRKWLGERMLQNISAHEYTLKNEPYENSVTVYREDIEDDQIGVYQPLIDDLGQSSRLWMDDLSIDCLTNGHTAAANTFDNVPFFSTAHPIDPSGQIAGTQSNYGTSTALNATNYATKRAAMRSLKGHDGKPMGVGRKIILAVPPALEDTGKRILEADLVVESNAGVTNVNKGTAELLVLDQLAGADTTWYLFDVSKPVKPLIHQVRKAPQLVRMDKESDEPVFMRRQFVYGVDMRGNAGYGLWFLAAKYVG